MKERRGEEEKVCVCVCVWGGGGSEGEEDVRLLRGKVCVPRVQ